jgi:hypothetical protein
MIRPAEMKPSSSREELRHLVAVSLIKRNLEDPGPGGGATARRTLGETMRNGSLPSRAPRDRGSSRRTKIMRLCAPLRRVTREYQCDQPSRTASPSGPGSSRDAPVVNDDAVASARPYQF